MAVRAAKSCVKFLVKAQEMEAILQKMAIMAMLFFLLQRSIRMETGNVKMMMDQ